MKIQFLKYPGSVGVGFYVRAKPGSSFQWRTRYIFLSFSRRPIGFVGW
jgi:hypothetical protein